MSDPYGAEGLAELRKRLRTPAPPEGMVPEEDDLEEEDEEERQEVSRRPAPTPAPKPKPEPEPEPEPVPEQAAPADVAGSDKGRRSRAELLRGALAIETKHPAWLNENVAPLMSRYGVQPGPEGIRDRDLRQVSNGVIEDFLASPTYNSRRSPHLWDTRYPQAQAQRARMLAERDFGEASTSGQAEAYGLDRYPLAFEDVGQFQPNAYRILSAFAGLRMGKSYESEEDLIEKFPLDYRAFAENQQRLVDAWEKVEKDEPIFGVFPDGQVLEIVRSKDADLNLEYSDALGLSGAPRIMLRDQTDPEYYRKAATVNAETVPADVVIGILGSKRGKRVLQTAFAAVVAGRRDETLMPLTYSSNKQITGIDVGDVRERLLTAYTLDHLSREGRVDWAAQPWDETKRLYPDEVEAAEEYGRRNAELYYRSTLDNEALSIRRRPFEREEELMAAAQRNRLPDDLTWAELIEMEGERVTKDVLKKALGEKWGEQAWILLQEREGAEIDESLVTKLELDPAKNPLEAKVPKWALRVAKVRRGMGETLGPAYKATFTGVPYADRAEIYGGTIEDETTARFIEASFRKMGMAGVGRTIDQTLRHGSFTQIIGAALELAKEDADEAAAGGDTSALRSDKILLAAFDYFDTPELVERVVRTEDGTGYLITELGNLVGFRAMAPWSGESWLPEYTEDVPFRGKGFARGVLGYTLGVLDESPGWIAAFVMEIWNPDAITAGTLGTGKLLGAGVRFGKALKQEASGTTNLKVGKLVDDVLADPRYKDAMPEELANEVRARAEKVDATGQVEEVLNTAGIDTAGNVHRQGQSIEELSESANSLLRHSDDLLRESEEALEQGLGAVDTTARVVELDDQIKLTNDRIEGLTAEAVLQEKLLQNLEGSRLELPGKKTPPKKVVEEVAEEVVEEAALPPKPKAPEPSPMPDNVRTAVPKEFDGVKAEWQGGGMGDIHKALYVVATKGRTKAGKAAAEWLDSLGITGDVQRALKGDIKKAVKDARAEYNPKYFKTLPITKTQRIKDVLSTFIDSKKGTKAVKARRDLLNRFLFPSKFVEKPLPKPKKAPAPKEVPKTELTAQSLVDFITSEKGRSARFLEVVSKRIATRKRTRAYMRRLKEAMEEYQVFSKLKDKDLTVAQKAAKEAAKVKVVKALGDHSELAVRLLSQNQDTVVRMAERNLRHLDELKGLREIAVSLQRELDPELLKRLVGRKFDPKARITEATLKKRLEQMSAGIASLSDEVGFAGRLPEQAQHIKDSFRASLARSAKVATQMGEILSNPETLRLLDDATRGVEKINGKLFRGDIRGALLEMARSEFIALPRMAKILGMTDEEIRAAVKVGTLNEEIATRFAIRKQLTARWDEVAPNVAINGLTFWERFYKTRGSLEVLQKGGVQTWGAYVFRAMETTFYTDQPFMKSHQFLAHMSADLGLAADRVYRRSRSVNADLRALVDAFLPRGGISARALAKGEMAIPLNAKMLETEVGKNLFTYLTSRDPHAIKSMLDGLGIGRDVALYGNVTEFNSLADDFYEMLALSASAAAKGGYPAKRAHDILGVNYFLASMIRAKKAGDLPAIANEVEREFYRLFNEFPSGGWTGGANAYRRAVELTEQAVENVNKVRAGMNKSPGEFVSPLVRISADDRNIQAMINTMEAMAFTSMEREALSRTFKISGGTFSDNGLHALIAAHAGPEALSKFLKNREFAVKDVVVLAEDATKLSDAGQFNLDNLAGTFINVGTKAKPKRVAPSIDAGLTRSWLIESINPESGEILLRNTLHPVLTKTVKSKDIAYRPPTFTVLDFFDATSAWGLTHVTGAARRGAAEQIAAARQNMLEMIRVSIGPNGTTRPVPKVIRDEVMFSVNNANDGIAAAIRVRLGKQRAPGATQGFLAKKAAQFGEYWKVGVLYSLSFFGMRGDRAMEIFGDDVLNTFVTPGMGEGADIITTAAGSASIAIGGQLHAVPVIGPVLARAANEQMAATIAKHGKPSLPPMVGVFTDMNLDAVLSGSPGVKLKVAEGTINARRAIREMVEDGIDDNIRAEDVTRLFAKEMGHEDLGASGASGVAAGRVPTSIREIVATPRGVGRAAKSLVKDLFGPTNISVKMMDRYIRSITVRQRAQMYFNLRTVKKVPRDEARRLTLEALYDWELAATRPIEQKYLKFIYPWYTWHKNVNMQMGATVLESGTTSIDDLARRYIRGGTRAQRLKVIDRIRRSFSQSLQGAFKDVPPDEMKQKSYEALIPEYAERYGILMTLSASPEMQFDRREQPGFKESVGISGPAIGTIETRDAWLGMGATIVMGFAGLVNPDVRLNRSLFEGAVDSVTDSSSPLAERIIRGLLDDPEFPKFGSRKVRLNENQVNALTAADKLGFGILNRLGHTVPEQGAPYYYLPLESGMDELFVRGLLLPFAGTLGREVTRFRDNVEAIPGGRQMLGIERNASTAAYIENIEEQEGALVAYLAAASEIFGYCNWFPYSGRESHRRELLRSKRELSQEISSIEGRAEFQRKRLENPNILRIWEEKEEQ